jgi:hypothetical protein
MIATSGGTCCRGAARAAGSENRSSPKGPAVTFSYCFQRPTAKDATGVSSWRAHNFTET